MAVMGPEKRCSGKEGSHLAQVLAGTVGDITEVPGGSATFEGRDLLELWGRRKSAGRRAGLFLRVFNYCPVSN